MYGYGSRWSAVFFASPATAGQFRASYDFDPGSEDDFTFEFDGEIAADGNLIQNLSNIGNFQFGGSPGSFSQSLEDRSFERGWGESFLSFDGTVNNLLFCNSGCFEGFYISSGGRNAFQIVNNSNRLRLFTSFEAERWRVEDSSFLGEEERTAVPTPALLPGLIGLGFSAIRKRNLAQSDEA